MSLRDYNIPDIIWGGKKRCKHKWGDDIVQEQSGGTVDYGHHVGNNLDDKIHYKNTSNFCTKCNAWKGQLGLEPTIDMFIQHLVEIFREVREVLRDDGVLWINIGDSFVTQPAGNKVPSGFSQTRPSRKKHSIGSETVDLPKRKSELKPLNLMMIPARLAIALQDDGWILRSDVIWQKVNPMPESVNGWRWVKHRIKVKSGYTEDNPHPSKTTLDGKTKCRMKNSGGVFKAQAEWEDCPGCDKCNDNDGYILIKGSWRPTKAHEYIFMLTKTDEYFGNAEAVREPLKQESKGRAMRGSSKDNKYAAGKERPPGVHAYEDMDEAIESGDTALNPRGRNKRTVWTIVAKGFKGAHFACFPEELPRLCIKASTSHKACPECKAPWAPVIDYKFIPQDDVSEEKGVRGVKEQKPMDESNDWEGFPRGTTETKTIGYRPTCSCQGNDGSGVCTVLDPFAGSFTTGKVARELGRSAIGIDISEEYKKIAEKRANLSQKAIYSYDEG